MASPQMIAQDIDTLNIVAGMLDTLHDVVMAESELTGHSIPASSGLVYVAQQTSAMQEAIQQLIEEMFSDLTPIITFSGDDTDEG